MLETKYFGRVKQADLLSSIGAGVIGVGIGLMLANILAGYVLPILILGLVSHILGMFQKHRLERENHVRIWLVEFLYWFCWLALAVLFFHIIIRQL